MACLVFLNTTRQSTSFTYLAVITLQMRRIRRPHFVRLLSCLLAISLSLGSVASASMMGMMPIVQDESTMTMQHDDAHHEHMQSAVVMSHAQMMQSGDHNGSHDMTCELLCAFSISLLPHIDFVPEVFHLTQLWSAPDSPDYLSNLHTLLFKPPRI